MYLEHFEIISRTFYFLQEVLPKLQQDWQEESQKIDENLGEPSEPSFEQRKKDPRLPNFVRRQYTLEQIIREESDDILMRNK